MRSPPYIYIYVMKKLIRWSFPHRSRNWEASRAGQAGGVGRADRTGRAGQAGRAGWPGQPGTENCVKVWNFLVNQKIKNDKMSTMAGTAAIFDISSFLIFWFIRNF